MRTKKRFPSFTTFASETPPIFLERDLELRKDAHETEIGKDPGKGDGQAQKCTELGKEL